MKEGKGRPTRQDKWRESDEEVRICGVALRNKLVVWLGRGEKGWGVWFEIEQWWTLNNRLWSFERCEETLKIIFFKEA